MGTYVDTMIMPPASKYIHSVEHRETQWYAAYTCANHEKQVAQQLVHRGVESYLPLYESLRLWKDRRVHLKLPLFPGYVFVRIALEDRLSVLGIPSVVRFVGFNGGPTPLPSTEIEALRRGLEEKLCVEPHPYLTVGRRVRIKRGPLEGLDGILLRKKSRYRIVVSIDLLQRSVIANIDAAWVVPVN